MQTKPLITELLLKMFSTILIVNQFYLIDMRFLICKSFKDLTSGYFFVLVFLKSAPLYTLQSEMARLFFSKVLLEIVIFPQKFLSCKILPWYCIPFEASTKTGDVIGVILKLKLRKVLPFISSERQGGSVSIDVIDVVQQSWYGGTQKSLFLMSFSIISSVSNLVNLKKYRIS